MKDFIRMRTHSAAWFGPGAASSEGVSENYVISQILVPARLEHITDGLSNTIFIFEQAGFPNVYIATHDRGACDYRSGRTAITPEDACLGEVATHPDRFTAAWPLSRRHPAVSHYDDVVVGAEFPGTIINLQNWEGIYSFHDGANMLFCDGSVHFLGEETETTVVLNVLTRDGSETVGE